AGLAASMAMAVFFTLINKSFAEKTCKFLRRAFNKISVVTFALARKQGVQNIVPVIVPLGIKSLLHQSLLHQSLLQETRTVVFIFQHQMYMTIRRHRCAHSLG